MGGAGGARDRKCTLGTGPAQKRKWDCACKEGIFHVHKDAFHGKGKDSVHIVENAELVCTRFFFVYDLAKGCRAAAELMAFDT